MAWMSGVAVGGVGGTKPGGGVAVGKGVGVDVDTAAAVGVGSGEAQAVSSPTNMNATVSRSKRIGVNARRSGRGEQRRETLAAGAVAPRQVCHELWTLVPPFSKPSSWAALVASSWWVGCSLTG